MRSLSKKVEAITIKVLKTSNFTSFLPDTLY